MAQFVVLTVEPFESEDAARRYLSHVRGALAWTVGTLGTGFDLASDFSHVKFTRDPIAAGANVAKAFGMTSEGPLDALADGSRPTVVPIGTRIKYLSGGDAQLTVRRSTVAFVEAFHDALQVPGVSGVSSDARLGIAVELLGQSHLESTPQSRFLSLTMALEVLTERGTKHPHAKRMLDAFHRSVVAALEQHDRASEEWNALDSLARDVLFRTEDSIRSRVRQLALDVFAGDVDAAHQAKLAVQAYDCRSSLIHTGRIEDARLSQALQVVETLVLRALRGRMKALVSQDDSAAPIGGA